jgi:diaminopimelate decarboxylase
MTRRPIIDWRRSYPAFDARALVAAYQSPLFLFFPAIFSENAARLRDALATCYKNFQINYSIKTNYLPCILSHLPVAGVAPEVISGFELEIVKRLGLLDARTVVNGSFKTSEDLSTAAKAGARINADSLEELDMINHIGSALGRQVPVGLRIHAQLVEGVWTRFGFHYDEGEVLRAAEYVRDALPRVRLNGLHLHGATNICDTGVFCESVRVPCRNGRPLA